MNITDQKFEVNKMFFKNVFQKVSIYLIKNEFCKILLQF